MPNATPKPNPKRLLDLIGFVQEGCKLWHMLPSTASLLRRPAFMVGAEGQLEGVRCLFSSALKVWAHQLIRLGHGQVAADPHLAAGHQEPQRHSSHRQVESADGSS